VAIRFAVLAGSGQEAFQIVEGAREQSDLSIRLRYADGAAMVVDHESLYRDAGYTVHRVATAHHGRAGSTRPIPCPKWIPKRSFWRTGLRR